MKRLLLCLAFTTFVILCSMVSQRRGSDKETRDDSCELAGKNVTEWTIAGKSVMEWTSGHKVTMQVWNVGLGNQLFAFASLLGIASANSMQPVLPHKLRALQRHFQMPVTSQLPHSVSFGFVQNLINTRKTYDKRTESLAEHDSDIQLIGYFFSWKYFQEILPLIREELQFTCHVQMEAKQFFIDKNTTYIAVHVRRTDFLEPSAQKSGYTAAPVSYFRRAMTYFRQRYLRVKFLVCSDDPLWCESSLTASDVLCVLTNDPFVDMAVMTMCDHSVISTGTFSWWVGLLTMGQTVYYKHFPRKGSAIEKHFNHDDYYLPYWIPMS